MVENQGNAYRTRGVIMAAVALMGIALGAILYGVAGVCITAVIGVVLIVLGIDIFVVGATYSSEPDKFGPSEQMYRTALGLVIALIGVILVIVGYDVSIWVAVAVLIIGIALIGLSTGLINSKKSKF